MKKITVALLATIFAATYSDAVAQSMSVRLEAHVDIWLGDTSIDLVDELTSKLQKALIAVTDRPDAPLVRFTYVERPIRGRPYGLVPSTEIEFKIEVIDDQDHSSSFGRLVPAIFADSAVDFPDALQLRARTLQAFRGDPMFGACGYIVGIALGLDTSFRTLLFQPVQPVSIEIIRSLLFGRVKWSPANDDLFEMVITLLEGTHLESTKWLETFLSMQMPQMQGADPPALRSTLVGVRLLAKQGGASAVDLLRRIAATSDNLQIVTAAKESIDPIDLRLAPPK